MDSIHIGAILIATVINIIIGSIWYSKSVFGNLWMKYLGMTEQSIKLAKSQTMTQSFLIEIIANLLTAYAFNVILTVTESGVFFIAFVVWLGFCLPIFASNVAWENRSPVVSLINAGYRLALLLSMAVVFLTV